MAEDNPLWDGEPIWFDEFEHQPAALRSVESDFRDAAAVLAEAIATESPTVDAGDSSDMVAAAIAALHGTAQASAHLLNVAADNIDATGGTYAEVENNAEGTFTYWQNTTGGLIDNDRDGRD